MVVAAPWGNNRREGERRASGARTVRMICCWKVLVLLHLPCLPTSITVTVAVTV
jgi:hypothetical protein